MADKKIWKQKNNKTGEWEDIEVEPTTAPTNKVETQKAAEQVVEDKEIVAEVLFKNDIDEMIKNLDQKLQNDIKSVINKEEAIEKYIDDELLRVFNGDNERVQKFKSQYSDEIGRTAIISYAEGIGMLEEGFTLGIKEEDVRVFSENRKIEEQNRISKENLKKEYEDSLEKMNEIYKVYLEKLNDLMTEIEKAELEKGELELEKKKIEEELEKITSSLKVYEEALEETKKDLEKLQEDLDKEFAKENPDQEKIEQIELEIKANNRKRASIKSNITKTKNKSNSLKDSIKDIDKKISSLDKVTSRRETLKKEIEIYNKQVELTTKEMQQRAESYQEKGIEVEGKLEIEQAEYRDKKEVEKTEKEEKTETEEKQEKIEQPEKKEKTKEKEKEDKKEKKTETSAYSSQTKLPAVTILTRVNNYAKMSKADRQKISYQDKMKFLKEAINAKGEIPKSIRKEFTDLMSIDLRANLKKPEQDTKEKFALVMAKAFGATDLNDKNAKINGLENSINDLEEYEYPLYNIDDAKNCLAYKDLDFGFKKLSKSNMNQYKTMIKKYYDDELDLSVEEMQIFEDYFIEPLKVGAFNQKTNKLKENSFLSFGKKITNPNYKSISEISDIIETGEERKRENNERGKRPINEDLSDKTVDPKDFNKEQFKENYENIKTAKKQKDTKSI